jgi:hypothetical protein
MVLGLLDFLDELEKDRSLDDPGHLRERIDALDRLEAYLGCEEMEPENKLPGRGRIIRRARALSSKLEAANCALYHGIRSRIQNGDRIEDLQEWLPKEGLDDGAVECETGLGYDYLDELISGALQFPAPEIGGEPLPPEMVFYQPTPARHIFDLIGRTALTEEDVLIDLGSGMGHVPLLASICTRARCIGIELQKPYIDCARQIAEEMSLSTVTFIEQDVRVADLSRGTVFYLYTPFTGSVLRAVLDLLRREGERREIRICSFGPCTTKIAEEPWLQTPDGADEGRIAVFRSRI